MLRSMEDRSGSVTLSRDPIPRLMYHVRIHWLKQALLAESSYASMRGNVMVCARH